MMVVPIAIPTVVMMWIIPTAPIPTDRKVRIPIIRPRIVPIGIGIGPRLIE